MSLVAYSANDFTARPRSQDLHALQARTAHAAGTLLMQGLRMLFVVSCFTAVVAVGIGIRVFAYMPAVHH